MFLLILLLILGTAYADDQVTKVDNDTVIVNSSSTDHVSDYLNQIASLNAQINDIQSVQDSYEPKKNDLISQLGVLEDKVNEAAAAGCQNAIDAQTNLGIKNKVPNSQPVKVGS